jgi:hypothetical protein
VRVKADDYAGNLGEFSESDGFVVNSENASECINDNSGPQLSVILSNRTCLKTFVEIECEDETGCQNIKYGVGSSSDDCNATSTYNGRKLEFTSDKFLCFSASDNKGNNASGSREINALDEDGDGVNGECDLCSSTNAGQISNIDGCSSQDIPDDETDPSEVEGLDSDEDGLPDRWEESNNVFSCAFDKDNADSDSNGISDALEDYDDDGATNLEEFNLQTNPCIADDNLPEQIVSDLIEEDDGESDVGDRDVDVSVTGSKPKEEEANLLAWILLIVGFLMFGGGLGYLIYYYKVVEGKGAGLVKGPGAGVVKPTVAVPAKEEGGLFDKVASKINEFKKGREQKVKERKRHELFGFFDKTSKDIPHVEKALASKADHHKKLNELANNYLHDKPKIDKGLRREERGIFDKLENIAKKTKDKDIKKVVSKGEAKDIFSKLRKLSKDRKK